MSPIAIHPSFTREYLDEPSASHPQLIDKMCRAFDRAAYEKDYIIIEGTGHAGVGSVFNLSNADVAKRLDAKVIIVAAAASAVRSMKSRSTKRSLRTQASK